MFFHEENSSNQFFLSSSPPNSFFSLKFLLNKDEFNLARVSSPSRLEINDVVSVGL
jgi:hypothetical protein